LKFLLSKDDIESPALRLIERISGEDLARCYQCGNCSGGCPVSYAMEIPPSQTLRLLQLGMADAVMEANSMWLCVGCLQCHSRCPKGVSAAAVFEAMRQISLRKGVDGKAIADMAPESIMTAPQQAIVCAFRKLVS
jgi:heterodisulfide reductase subunit C